MKGLDYKGIIHYKTYPRFEKIGLENVLSDSPLRRMIRERRTKRVPSKVPFNGKILHNIVAMAAGRTGKSDEYLDFRAYPSGGARYPLELYLVIFDIDGLGEGIYHFSPLDNTLEVLWLGDYKNKIDKLLDNAIKGFVENAKAFIIITSIEDRTTFKYSDEGKIFPYIEAGLLSQNLNLLFDEVGINIVMIGMPWCAEEIGKLLDLNQMKENIITASVIL